MLTFFMLKSIKKYQLKKNDSHISQRTTFCLLPLRTKKFINFNTIQQIEKQTF